MSEPRAGAARAWVPKAVLDTNILVSALITPRGTPGRVVRAWRDGSFELVTSPSLLEELREALHRPKIMHRYHLSPKDIQDLLALLANTTTMVTGTASVPDILSDPDDVPVLACAAEGQADYIVTGDGDLLRLKSYKGTRIVRPSAFLKTL